MKDSYAANDEVAAVRAQLAALMKTSLPADVARAATHSDAKLATVRRTPTWSDGGRRGGGGLLASG
jgi:hypothetical protein